MSDGMNNRRVSRGGRALLGYCLCALAVSAGPAAASSYQRHDLVSDQPGMAPLVNPDLVDAWGLALRPTGGHLWIDNNVSGTDVLYLGDVGSQPLMQDSLPLVTYPLPVRHSASKPALSGQAYNPTQSFVITQGGTTAPAVFISVSEDGAIYGWTDTAEGDPAASAGVLVVDNSRHGAGARFKPEMTDIYKGVTVTTTPAGDRMFVANFAGHRVDTYDGQWKRLHTLGFHDPNLPKGYSPFNVAAIGSRIYVAYAKTSNNPLNETDGPGLGYVAAFDLSGAFLFQFDTEDRPAREVLDAPWGIVQTPTSFGPLGGAILVGNFGVGHINAFDPNTGHYLGRLKDAQHRPIAIDGLWGLAFGNGTAGDTKRLYYTAGPDDEAHGLFGYIEVSDLP